MYCKTFYKCLLICQSPQMFQKACLYKKQLVSFMLNGIQGNWPCVCGQLIVSFFCINVVQMTIEKYNLNQKEYQGIGIFLSSICLHFYVLVHFVLIYFVNVKYFLYFIYIWLLQHAHSGAMFTVAHNYVFVGGKKRCFFFYYCHYTIKLS